MTGSELDQRLRQILAEVTPETSLSSSMALVELGVATPRAAFELVIKTIRAKENATRDTSIYDTIKNRHRGRL